MAKKKYDSIYDYEKDIDYATLMNKAAESQDYQQAALLEQQRNAKIRGEGLTQYSETSDYAKYLPAEKQGLQYQTYEPTQYDRLVPGSQEVANAQAALAQLQLPEYRDTLGPEIRALYEQMQGRADFSYDPSRDVAYEQYKKLATLEGERAAEDTMARVSARTGGMMSSYGASAAAQQQQYYAQQIAAKLPEYEQMAYQRYLNEFQMMAEQMQGLQRMEAQEYGRYRDTVSDTMARAQFQYGALSDEYQRAREEYQLGYQAERDIRDLDSQEYERMFAAEQFEHKKSMDERELALKSSSVGLDWEKYRTMVENELATSDLIPTGVGEEETRPGAFAEMGYDQAVESMMESGLRQTHNAQDAASFVYSWLVENKDRLSVEAMEQLIKKYITKG